MTDFDIMKWLTCKLHLSVFDNVFTKFETSLKRLSWSDYIKKIWKQCTLFWYGQTIDINFFERKSITFILQMSSLSLSNLKRNTIRNLYAPLSFDEFEEAFGRNQSNLLLTYLTTPCDENISWQSLDFFTKSTLF